MLSLSWQPRVRRRAGLAAVLAMVTVVAAGAHASSAHAYALTSPATGDLVAAPDGVTQATASATSPAAEGLAITVGVSGSNLTFAPAADSAPTACSAGAGGADTVCPTTMVANELELNADVVNVSNVQSQTLDLVGTPDDDHFVLSGVTLGAFHLDPGGGADSLDVTGSVTTMALDNAPAGGGSLDMNFDAGPTSGTLQLGPGNNYINAPTSMLSLTGGGGDNTLSAGGTIDGGHGNNTIHAVSTTQTIDAGNGNNVLDFLSVATPLTLTLNPDGTVLVGSETTAHITGIAQLTGSSGDTTLIAGPVESGSTGAVILIGGPGNNTFVPNGGPDILEGGAGNNTVDYSRFPSSTPLTVNLPAGTGGPTGGAADSQDQLIGIQSVTANDGNNTITGQSTLGGTFLLGNGNDTFTGGDGNNYVQGGAGTDSITVGNGNNTIMGASGNERITAGNGDNYIDGGPGNDMIEPGDGNNTIIGGGGNDTLSFANRSAGEGVTATLSSTGTTTGNGQPGENDTISGIQNLIGGAGYNILTGDSANNSITGGPSGNTITGGSGKDVLVGGAGDDTIYAGTGTGTTIDGRGGNDRINALDGVSDTIDCGTGATIATVNPTDAVNSNCQTVLDPDIPPPTTTNTVQCVFVPGQTCDGYTTPYPPVTSTVPYNYIPLGRYTVFSELQIVGLVAQSGISISCTTPALDGCPFHTRIENFKSARAKVSLMPLLRHHRLPAGTKLRLRIVAPLSVGREILFTMRNGKGPRVDTSCLSPTTGKVITCPAGGYLTASTPVAKRRPAQAALGQISPSRTAWAIACERLRTPSLMTTSPNTFLTVRSE